MLTLTSLCSPLLPPLPSSSFSSSIYFAFPPSIHLFPSVLSPPSVLTPPPPIFIFVLAQDPGGLRKGPRVLHRQRILT